MVRTYKRKKVAAYTPQLLKQAVEAVNSGMMNFSEAAREFSIPRNTIRINLFQTRRHVGGQTIFSKEQEEKMCQRLLYISKRGFPLSVADFLKIVYTFATKLDRRKLLQCPLPKTWHVNEMASYDWWLCYKKRYPVLALRLPEGLSSARAEAFNEERVQNFFSEYTECIQKLGLQQYPCLTFNCDETGLSSVPSKSSKVIAQKGVRSVQQITTGERGTLTTLLLCANVIGDYIPPFLIFKGAIPLNAEHFPKDSKLVRTKSGYIDSESFILFLKHFADHRPVINGKKPVLVLDGHTSHLSIDAIDFVIRNEIELFCLPPHCTQRLQPLDTHVNKTVKNFWRKSLRGYLSRSDRVVLTRHEFAFVFQPMWDDLTKGHRGLVVDSFEHCGLYPPKNPTSPEEFQMAKNYVSQEISSEINGTTSCQNLRALIPSPRKIAKPVHRRPHTAHISLADNLTIMQQKSRSFPNAIGAIKQSVPSVEVVVNSSPQFREHGTPLPLAKRIGMLTKHSKCHGPIFPTNSEVPSTSSGIRHSAPHSSLLDQSAMKKRKPNATCCVCSSQWRYTSEEWLRCVACGEWACETCFLSITCFNCS